VMAIALAGQEAWLAVNRDKDADVARGEDYTRVFQAFADARELAEGLEVLDWNQATNAVIADTAAAQIMGDWAQGEFAIAGEVAGEDYSCLPGLGDVAILDAGGDAFYFPVTGDPDMEAAQKEMAALLLSPEVQVAFNSAKGSLPIRGDVDLTSVNECTQKGLDLLAAGNILPSGNVLLTPDTATQINDLMTEFWSSDSMTVAEVQEAYAQLIEQAN